MIFSRQEKNYALGSESYEMRMKMQSDDTAMRRQLIKRKAK
jgi:hypothetical protein